MSTAAQPTATAPTKTIQGLSNLIVTLDRKIRTFQLVRALSAGAALVVGALMLAALIDWIYPVGPAFRLMFLILLAGGTIAGGIGVFLRYRRSSIEQAELAAVLGQGQSELSEKVLSAWELANDPSQSTSTTAVYVEEQLCDQLEPRLAHLQREQPLTRRKTILVLAVLVAVVAVIVGIAVAAASPFRQQASRMLTPWNEVLQAQNAIQIMDPDRTVQKGSSVELVVSLTDPEDQKLIRESFRLVLHPDSDEAESFAMTSEADSDYWKGLIPSIEETTTYRVEIGELQSRVHEIHVIEPPNVESLEVTIQPPAYTHLPPQVVRNPDASIEVFEGSTVRLDLRLDRSVETAAIDLTNEDDETASIDFMIDSEQFKGAVDLEVVDRSVADLRVAEREGYETTVESVARFNIRRDEPPAVRITSPDTSVTVRRDDVISIQIAAHDDFELGTMQLHLNMGLEEPLVLPIDQWELQGDEYRATVQLDLSDLPLEEKSSLTYVARVSDRRPVPGPQEAFSDEHRLEFNDQAAAPGTEELDRSHQQIKDLIDRAREQLKETAEKIDELEQNEDPDQDPKERQEEAQRLAGEQVQAARNLNELEQRLREHPIMDALANEVGELNEQKVQRAADDLQEWSEEPAGELNPIEDEIRDAEQQLADVERRFNDLAQLEKDLLELDRLANQAGRIAERVADTQQQQQPNAAGDQQPADIDPQEQRQLEDDIDRTSDRLNDLVKRHDELKDKVESAFRDRASEVADGLKDLAEPEDRIADSFDRELERLQPQLDQIADAIDQADQELADDNSPEAANARQQLDQARDALEDGNIADALDHVARSRQALNGQPTENRNPRSDTPEDQAPQNNRPDADTNDANQANDPGRRPEENDPNGDEPENSQNDIDATSSRQLAQVSRIVADALDQQAKWRENGESPPQESQKSDQLLKDAVDQIGKAAEELEKFEVNQGQELNEDAEKASEQIDDGELNDAADSMRRLARKLDAGAQQAQSGDARNSQNSAKPDTGSVSNPRPNTNSDSNPSPVANQPPANDSGKPASSDNNSAEQPSPDADKTPHSDDKAGTNSDAPTGSQPQEPSGQPTDDGNPSDASSDAGNDASKDDTSEKPADAQLDKVENDLNRLANEQQQARQTQKNASRNALAEALARQHELQQQARQMAGNGEPQDSAPPEEARDRLNEIDESSQQLMNQAAAGDTEQAGETTEKLAELAEELAQQASDESLPEDQQQSLGELAEQQSENAEALADALESTQSPQESAEAAQEAIEEQTGKYSDELSRIEQKLGELGAEAEQTQQGRQTAENAERAEESVSEAQQESEKSNLANASQAARKAAQAMRQAASPPGQPDQGNQPQEPTEGSQTAEPGNEQGAEQGNDPGQEPGEPSAQPGSEPSPIPAQAGGELANAMDKLQQARDQLGQGQPQPGQASGEPGQEPSGQEGNPGDNQGPSDFSGLPQNLADLARQLAQQSGEPQQGEGQSGQPPEGGAEGQPQEGSQDGSSGSGSQPGGQSKMQQLAESLQQAAQSMAKASQQMQPGSESESGSGGGEGSGGGAPDSELSSARLDDLLKQRAGKNWGQLPGTLSTEMLQTGPDQKQSDYENLIKQYFQRIATLESEPEDEE